MRPRNTARFIIRRFAKIRDMSNFIHFEDRFNFSGIKMVRIYIQPRDSGLQVTKLSIGITHTISDIR